MPQIAVLDDYLGLAKDCADWASLPAQWSVTFIGHYLGDADAVVTALVDFEVLVVMRERTPLPKAVLECLPKLRLVVTYRHAKPVYRYGVCAQPWY